MDLKNKVIIITGASSGIGRELALCLAKEGARLSLAARRSDALSNLAQKIIDSGGQAISIPADVSQRSHMENLVLKSMKAYGRIDAMVLNAGVTHAPLDLTDLSESEFRRVLETNLMGPVYGVWEGAPAIAKGGMLVFVSSVVGKRGVYQNAAYCASKFALQGLTESIRPELKKKGIHVLTVCPPGVDTPFFEVNGRGQLRRYRLHSPEKIAKMIVEAMKSNKRDVLLTMDAKLLAWEIFSFRR
jgi:NAD(P)-dependent dehydrogenase (short-subunit alcohol dehydrogenase family)